MIEENHPLKIKNLKVIDHIGILYVTLNGSTMWEMDKSAHIVLKMCDGTRTINEISSKIARKISLDVDVVKATVKTILNELERLKFIEYV